MLKYKKQESSLELPHLFVTAMQNASPLLAVARTGARAPSPVPAGNAQTPLGSASTRARASVATAPAATCNGFRRVDRVGCELIKY